jgi:hypothetical protein
MEKGKFVISLDFELVWGVFDHITLTDKVAYFDNTLEVIPKMLACFEKHQLHVTWATVGMLFNQNWEEWLGNKPSEMPTYANTKLDAYAYGLQHQHLGLDRFFFAPELIRMIQNTPGQELATHTYSHYYCLESGQTKRQFECDLDLAKKMAAQFGATLHSLVFPRNQWNPDYLFSCQERGITQLRSNPDAWYWKDTSQSTLATKLFRTGDAYLPLGSTSYPMEKVTIDFVTAQPASRFLRPHHRLSFLNSLRLQRIKNEMLHAAKQGEVYHLWWHPHNFGNHPAESMVVLHEIALWFTILHEKYGMESVPMKDLTSAIQ